MVDRDWAAAAREIREGWSVRKYLEPGGEFVGTVIRDPELTESEVLRILVSWQFKDRSVDEVLSEPLRLRSLRRSESAVVISSTGSLTVFEPGSAG